MRVRHPEALDDVGGECPDRVDLGGDAYDCGDGRAFDVSESQAEALAERYGVDVAAIAVGEETGADPSDGDESGTCEVVKTDGDVCGRERPCSYHD